MCVCMRVFFPSFLNCCYFVLFVCRFLFVELSVYVEIPVPCVSVTIWAEHTDFILYTGIQMKASSRFFINILNIFEKSHTLFALSLFLSLLLSPTHSLTAILNLIFRFFSVFAQGRAKIINVCLAKKKSQVTKIICILNTIFHFYFFRFFLF